MTVAADLGVQVTTGNELDKLAVNGRLVDLAVEPPAVGTILLAPEERVRNVLRIPVVAVGSVLALEAVVSDVRKGGVVDSPEGGRVPESHVAEGGRRQRHRGNQAEELGCHCYVLRECGFTKE